jgi:hypothetical protein
MAQPIPGGWGQGLLFGFSQGMLGVTGFETAANYIEEQRKGVYVKTLRNMWWSVFILNPIISLVCIGTLPLSEIIERPNDVMTRMVCAPQRLCIHVHQNRTFRRRSSPAATSSACGLPQMQRSSLRVPSPTVSFQTPNLHSFLPGSVLTAFIGVTGLIRRLSLDRCLPQVGCSPHEFSCFM